MYLRMYTIAGLEVDGMDTRWIPIIINLLA